MSDEQSRSREDREARLQNNKAEGEAGETAARALLLKLFKRVSPESSLRARSSDEGVDLEARWLCSDADETGCGFHFQVKTQPASRRFVVTRRDFENWQILSLVDKAPVFLLFYNSKHTVDEEVRFLSWHAWALHNATHPFFTSHQAKTFSIDVDTNFASVGHERRAFHSALVDELKQAKGLAGAPFRTSLSFALPVDLKFLLEHLETAPHLWLPEAVSREMSPGSGPEEVRLQFLRAWQGEKMIGRNLRDFVEPIKRTYGPIPNSFERSQFAWFGNAMIWFQRPETRASDILPPFSARTIACWRCFAAYFPESLHLFTHLAQHGSFNDRLFSRVILPVLVVAAGTNALATADPVLGSLRRLRTELTGIHSVEGYMLARETRRGILETGCATNSEERQTIDFMDRHSKEGWDTQYLSVYGGGWEGAGAIQKAEQKLTKGTLRDAHTRRFHTWMRDRLPRMLRSAPKDSNKQKNR